MRRSARCDKSENQKKHGQIPLDNLLSPRLSAPPSSSSSRPISLRPSSPTTRNSRSERWWCCGSGCSHPSLEPNEDVVDAADRHGL
eukprot:scaffold50208_cov33-Phaeocystis_antarctica.AAC.1